MQSHRTFGDMFIMDENIKAFTRSIASKTATAFEQDFSRS